MTNTDVLGFTWKLPQIQLSPHDKGVQGVCFEVKKMLVEYVWDIIHLEGNPYTFAEVQTLLSGTTVGGHSVSDQVQVLNQNQAILTLMKLVKENSFTISREIHAQLHGLVAKEEALTWGEFRTGEVSISGTNHRPPPASELSRIYENGIIAIQNSENVLERALVTYLFSALNQFFFDGNKRTGRLMMNGVLMTHGYRYLSIPGSRKDEFDKAMIDFYDTKDATKIMAMMLSCY